jgi:hypothetical protein
MTAVAVLPPTVMVRRDVAVGLVGTDRDGHRRPAGRSVTVLVAEYTPVSTATLTGAAATALLFASSAVTVNVTESVPELLQVGLGQSEVEVVARRVDWRQAVVAAVSDRSPTGPCVPALPPPPPHAASVAASSRPPSNCITVHLTTVLSVLTFD